ncbi:hypothetical protein AVEN_271190-1 [Araneus ventricosus]|uniref:Uncharacterized protein n=1 Tax=Araneus ventricosus TaxID=182803 RepID=A0A4Y2TND8_ARAVE|nr:hypothetical protein AVEN_271190-1 [Araneus ventricosus]
MPVLSLERETQPQYYSTPRNSETPLTYPVASHPRTLGVLPGERIQNNHKDYTAPPEGTRRVLKNSREKHPLTRHRAVTTLPPS